MNLRYPIGEFNFEGEITKNIVMEWIKEIEILPNHLKETVEKLHDDQLNTPYREGGWTVRQVVHHIADSHLNAFVRVKLALTEEKPFIKTYDENKWVELSDYDMPVIVSLGLLEGLHSRWVQLLSGLNDAELKKVFLHPELGEVSIGKCIALYAWHGKHHLAHITSLCNRMGW